MENEIKEKKEFNCHLCNYKTNSISDWFKHCETNKHKRNGNKLPTKCDKCDYTTSNHWNLKLHNLAKHSTVEERKQQKYYCDTCDLVLFCPQYLEKHNNGRNHKNMVRAMQLQEDINNIK